MGVSGRHNNCGGWTTAKCQATEKHVAPPFNKYTDLLHSNQDEYKKNERGVRNPHIFLFHMKLSP